MLIESRIRLSQKATPMSSRITCPETASISPLQRATTTSATSSASINTYRRCLQNYPSNTQKRVGEERWSVATSPPWFFDCRSEDMLRRLAFFNGLALRCDRLLPRH
jgi:hypothetical protein